MHPLNNNLSELSDEDLHKKYGELQKRYVQAYRFGPSSVVPQIQMLMQDYQYEIKLRNDRQYEEMTKNLKGPKGIIDIS